jgi:hypothetical protein
MKGKVHISILVLASLILGTALTAYAQVTAIPTLKDLCMAGDKQACAADRPVPFFIGQEAVPKPIITRPIPDNPYWADGSWSSYHNDPYQSDTYFTPGPLGHDPIVDSVYLENPVIPIIFYKDGRMAAAGLRYGADGTSWYWQLRLMDRETLGTLDTLDLPGDVLGAFLPVGVCWYVDQDERIVTEVPGQSIWAISRTGDLFDKANIKRYDLSGASSMKQAGEIRFVAPDWVGHIWFVTRGGTVGTLDPTANDGQGQLLGTLQLGSDELFENGMSVDEDGGVYAVSSRFMYRFDAGEDGTPVLTWREPYDAGTHVKVQSRGSGTTPTVMGTDYVAIADNADPQIHVLVYRRAKELAPGQQRLVCSVPVFEPGQSNTENSLIATDTSIVVENNFGYRGTKSVENGKTTRPGITRIDIDADGNGCHTVWTNMEEVVASTATQKLSLPNGLIYAYTKDKGPANTAAWYFTAIDFFTGETVYKVLAGTGPLYNDHIGVLYVGPNGRIYLGVMGGIVTMRDGK